MTLDGEVFVGGIEQFARIRRINQSINQSINQCRCMLCVVFSCSEFFLVFFSASSLKCYCEGEGCAEHHINSTCLAGKDAKCYATIREVPDKRTEEVHVVYEYGCLPAEENTILQCRGNLPPQVFYRFRIECCGHEDFCNDGMVPELPPRVITTPEPNTLPFDALKVDWRYVGAALAIVLGVSVAISIYCCFRYD